MVVCLVGGLVGSGGGLVRLGLRVLEEERKLSVKGLCRQFDILTICFLSQL